jgi:hypothetical protein
MWVPIGQITEHVCWSSDTDAAPAATGKVVHISKSRVTTEIDLRFGVMGRIPATVSVISLVRIQCSTLDTINRSMARTV